MKSTRFHGWGAFGAIMTMLAGAFLLVQGLVAMFGPEFFLGAQADLMFATFGAWGIVLGILGVVMLLAGIALFFGQMWARALGVVLAAGCAIVQVGFLTAFPVWSLAVIAVSVLAIYALTAGWSMMPRAEEEREAVPYEAGRADATRGAPAQRRGGAHERPDMPASGGATASGQ